MSREGRGRSSGRSGRAFLSSIQSGLCDGEHPARKPAGRRPKRKSAEKHAPPARPVLISSKLPLSRPHLSPPRSRPAMARLPTQPAQQQQQARAVPLRSGFFALPLSGGKVHLFARLHHSDDDAAAEEEGQQHGTKGKELFVTGFPHGTTAKGLKAALAKVWGGDDEAKALKVREVRMLPPAVEGTDVVSVLKKELAAAEGNDEGGDYMPLFDPSAAAAATAAGPDPSSSSAIATFSSAPPFPPAPYDASHPLTLPAAASFLSLSRARHTLARPPRSLVTSHVDAWMRSFDARRAASLPVGYSAERAAAQRELAAREAKKAAKQARRLGKNGRLVVVGEPKEGSAAEALARHAALQAKLADPSYNPDELDEGEWTTVSRGGKHGRSLLPAGVEPTVQGYGGVSVKVAGKKRGARKADDEVKHDAGIKKIVGEGFYRFNKAEGRRKGAVPGPLTRVRPCADTDGPPPQSSPTSRRGSRRTSAGWTACAATVQGDVAVDAAEDVVVAAVAEAGSSRTRGVESARVLHGRRVLLSGRRKPPLAPPARFHAVTCFSCRACSLARLSWLLFGSLDHTRTSTAALPLPVEPCLRIPPTSSPTRILQGSLSSDTTLGPLLSRVLRPQSSHQPLGLSSRPARCTAKPRWRRFPRPATTRASSPSPRAARRTARMATNTLYHTLLPLRNARAPRRTASRRPSRSSSRSRPLRQPTRRQRAPPRPLLLLPPAGVHALLAAQPSPPPSRARQRTETLTTRPATRMTRSTTSSA